MNERTKELINAFLCWKITINQPMSLIFIPKRSERLSERCGSEKALRERIFYSEERMIFVETN